MSNLLELSVTGQAVSVPSPLQKGRTWPTAMFAAVAVAGALIVAPVSDLRMPTSSPSVMRTGSQWINSSQNFLKKREENAAEAIVSLRDISGLSASQIAGIFGVSRRSVQNWVAGMPMSERNQTRLAEVRRLIESLGDSPSQRYSRLTRSSRGETLLQQLVAQNRSAQVLHPPARSALEQWEV